MSDPRTTPRRRPRRKLRALLACLVALAAIAGAIWFFIIPQVARQRIDALLRQYEPGHRQFDIESIGLSSLTLSNLELGRDRWLHAGRVDVRYRLSDLLHGKVVDVSVSDFEWRVAADAQGINWGFTVPPRSQAAAPSPLPFNAISLRNGRLLLDAYGRDVVVPFDCTATAAGRTINGQVSTQAVSIAGERCSGFETSFSFDGSRLRAEPHWPLIADAPMTSTIDFNFSGEHAAGTIALAQPGFALEDAPLLKMLWPAFGAIQSAGRLSLDAEFTLAGGHLIPRMTLRASDIALADDQWPLAIASASGTVVLDSFSPLSTDGPQRIRIDSATSGELDITSAELNAELDDAGLLRVHAARWFMSDGGRYEATPTTIDLSNPRIITSIACANVDFDFWLRLMTGDRADGQGRLEGEFAIDWNPQARPRIQFTGGSLVAVPSTGYLRIHDAPALSELLDQADPRFTIDETLRIVKERIIAALQDLGYTSLEMRFVPDGRDTILRVEIKGKGRRGANAQEFSGLVLNIGHFAASLQGVMDEYSAVERLPALLARPRTPRVPPVGAPENAAP